MELKLGLQKGRNYLKYISLIIELDFSNWTTITLAYDLD